ncbi:hypothetical protein ACS5PN_03965 [Roseateles sp. NT4]|uniref:hypothetical protein n=1 Tax=Roseateles sp. NT4 TaxID=3453715 RepID=UPI003EEC1211
MEMAHQAHQFAMLGRKQLAIQEGIALLQSAQMDLASARASASAWGIVGVMANVTLIPLNVIVNSFELKGASSLYQVVVHELYGKFAKSGTRLEDGHVKTMLSLLKQGIVAELKRKAMTDYIPGVNILVGLAEDSYAAWQAAALVESGNREIAALAVDLDRKIRAASQQLIQLGIKRAEILDRLQIAARTA